jgi:hypothetical protein
VNNGPGRLPTTGTTPWGTWKRQAKTMADAALHRTVDKLSPWLQCYHDQHSSTTSDPTAMWPQDQDDGHSRASTSRRRSLQAKLARTSLKLLTLRSGEPPFCNEFWPQTLYKGGHGSHLGTRSHSLSSTIRSIHHSNRAPGAYLRAAPRPAYVLRPLSPFLNPYCKNFRAFNQGARTRSSLRLDVGLWPEPV